MINTLNFFTSIQIFFILVVFGLIPGIGMSAMIAKSFSQGFKRTVIMAAGIASGDIVFIIVAVYGFTLFNDTNSSFFYVMKYLGSAYFIYLAVTTFLNAKKQDKKKDKLPKSTDFIGGFFITLSNPKVFLFYFTFFPNVIALNKLSKFEMLSLILIAFLAIFFVMAGIAYLAEKISKLFKSDKTKIIIDYISALVFLITTLFILFN